jgi:HSP20 family protein
MLSRWNDIDRTFATLDLLRQALWDAGAAPAATPRRAAVNVYDAGGELVVQAEVPGFAERDLEVTFDKGVLQVKGTQKLDAPTGYTLLRQERTPATFARSFKLPPDVDAERITAQLANGVLTVRLPKRPEAQPRTIAVKKV